MESIFEIPWRDVELKHVKTFVASASGEGLIWEAKATDPLSRLKRKIIEAVCGLANQLGGFVIVGAKQVNDKWKLEGVPNDVKEDAHDWLCRIITGNLIDAPSFDVRRWKIDTDRVAAVIRVEQAAAPPCMTKDGIVWQRLNTETKKVTDPSMLAGLIDRGKAARDLAEKRAVAAVNRHMYQAPICGTAESLRVALALAPVAAAEDIAGRLFTQEFRDALIQSATVLERAFVDERHAPGVVHPQRDGYVVRRGSNHPEGWEWALQAAWDGTVSVEFAASRTSRKPLVDVIVSQAWMAAADPLPLLTGLSDRGQVPTHLALGLTGQTFDIPRPDGLYLVASTEGVPYNGGPR
jgi:Putative DNA-binding domain